MSHHTIIKSVDAKIHTFSRPFTRVLGPMKFQVGGRMTIVQMNDGGLFVFSPIALDNSLREHVERLGQVKYIILPDIEHHLFAKDYLLLNQNATVIGVPGLDKKRKDLSFEHIMKPGGPENQHRPFGLEEEFDYLYLNHTVNRESLWFHKPTKTLLTADMLWTLPATEQYSKAGPNGTPQKFTWMSWWNNRWMNPDSIGHTAFMWYAMAKGQPGRDQIGEYMKKVVQEWKPEQIVMCHGDLVEKDAIEVLKKAFRWWKL